MRFWDFLFFNLIISAFSKVSGQWKSTRPYINEFFIKLAKEENLESVQNRATTLNLIWLQQMTVRLHLFRKTDMPPNNEEAVSDEEISRWMNAFGNMVEFIEQDKYVQIYAHYEMDRDHILLLSGNQSLEPTTFKPESNLNVPKPQALALKSSDKRERVTVAVLDAFFDTNHQNLRNNILKEEAYNFVDGNNKAEPDVFPDDFFEEHYPDLYQIYSHGTKCMGRISSSAEHGCNEGGDVSAKIIPLKFIDDNGITREQYEVAALRYKGNDIDIYSCSYGSRDNYGFITKSMQPIKSALDEGVSMGRNCKGSIYLFPSGNGDGNEKLDNCNTDVYATSINTITIASITMSNEIAEEAETCPCSLVSTFGSPAPNMKQYMNTTKPKNKCTFDFRGGSAATAYAAGTISHALRANPNLSKRDIEHLLVRAADTNLHPSVKWKENGAKLKFNEKIGFGAINLSALTKAAMKWNYVPEKHKCFIYKTDGSGGFMTGKSYVSVYTIRSDACRRTQNHVRHLEHVQLEVELSCSNISELAINLISPMGTTVGLLTKITVSAKRKFEYYNLRWTFMAVHLWGENPEGDWRVELIVNASQTVTTDIHIKKLILHGTEKNPLTGGMPLKCKHKQESLGSSFLDVAIAVMSLVVTCIAVGIGIFWWNIHIAQ